MTATAESLIEKADPNPPTSAVLTPKMQKREFADRLHKRMLEKNMTQSGLARKIWGQGPRGAIKRDRISNYVNGREMPDDVNMKLIAEALGTTAEDLCPSLMATRSARAEPEIEMKQIAGHPERTLLNIRDKVVPLEVAAKIIVMLSELDKE